jgi:hypothetical protein
MSPTAVSPDYLALIFSDFIVDFVVKRVELILELSVIGHLVKI